MTQTPRYTRRRLLQIAGQAAAGSVAAGCVPGSAVSTTGGAPAGIDPADLDPLPLTAAMVRFDTSHNGEGGVTLPHAQWLKAKWDAAGAATEIIPTPKRDNVHLIARIKGTTPAPPLLLLGHSDVVSVERDRWSVDPYGGVVQDGWVYGRGALDMKGANAAFMSALLRHLHEGATFDRDIIFLSDCDEEAGLHGTRWLAEQGHWNKINAGAVLTEGGWLLTQRDSTTPMIATLTRQDKIGALVELSTRGTTTHSSKPLPDGALVRLNRALARLADYQPAVFISDVAREHFVALAERTDNTKLASAVRLMLSAPGQPERDRAGALVVQLSDYPGLHNALMRHTVSYVIQQGGYRANVIPGSAIAQVNVRFIPGGPSVTQTLAEMRAAINDPQITMRLKGLGVRDDTHEQALARLEETMAKPASSIDTDVFRAWQKAVATTYPEAAAVPGLFEAGTSGGVWRQRGIPVYGIYPYAVDNDTINRMHGNDERVRVDALQRGTQLMYELFAQFR